MAVTIYHNPQCSKSRQTLELINQNVSSVEIIEYLQAQLSAEKLLEIKNLLGVDLREIMRQSDPLYTELQLADAGLKDEQLIQAIINHPKLLQRPIVVNKGKAVIGRPPENVLTIL